MLQRFEYCVTSKDSGNSAPLIASSHTSPLPGSFTSRTIGSSRKLPASSRYFPSSLPSLPPSRPPSLPSSQFLCAVMVTDVGWCVCVCWFGRTQCRSLRKTPSASRSTLLPPPTSTLLPVLNASKTRRSAKDLKARVVQDVGTSDKTSASLRLVARVVQGLD